MSEYVSPILREVKTERTTDLVEDQIAWYVVAIALLAALGITVIALCVLVCIAKGKSFSGYYQFVNDRHDVKIGCN